MRDTEAGNTVFLRRRAWPPELLARLLGVPTACAERALRLAAAHLTLLDKPREALESYLLCLGPRSLDLVRAVASYLKLYSEC